MARSAAQRLLHTAVLLPLVLFAVSNLRFAGFLCSMDGGTVLRDACCCPRADAEESPGPAVQAASCCELRSLTVVRPPSEPPRLGATLPLDPPALVSSPLVMAAAPEPALPAPAPSARPPRAGPSLLALKQTLLI